MLSKKQKAVLTDMELNSIRNRPSTCPSTNMDHLQAWDAKKNLESLADTRIKSEARRKMLKKHEFVDDSCGQYPETCLECRCFGGHAPDCALDALLTPKENQSPPLPARISE